MPPCEKPELIQRREAARSDQLKQTRDSFAPFHLFKNGSAVGVPAPSAAIKLPMPANDAKAQAASAVHAELNLSHDSA